MWALRYANVFIISRLRTKVPNFKMTTVVDHSRSVIEKCWACIVPRAFDVMILYLSQDDNVSSCGLWIQISTMANFETEVYELFKFLTRPGDKHDKKVNNILLFESQAGPSSRFCHESQDFLNFRTTCDSQSHGF